MTFGWNIKYEVVHMLVVLFWPTLAKFPSFRAKYGLNVEKSTMECFAKGNSIFTFIMQKNYKNTQIIT